MKKLLLSAVFMSLVFTSCGSDDDDGFDCVAATQDIAAKLQAFSDDDSNANCLALRASFQSAIDGGCDSNGTFQSGLESTVCN